jgi:hypothetical protein
MPSARFLPMWCFRSPITLVCSQRSSTASHNVNLPVTLCSKRSQLPHRAIDPPPASDRLPSASAPVCIPQELRPGLGRHQPGNSAAPGPLCAVVMLPGHISANRS